MNHHHTILKIIKFKLQKQNKKLQFIYPEISRSYYWNRKKRNAMKKVAIKRKSKEERLYGMTAVQKASEKSVRLEQAR